MKSIVHISFDYPDRVDSKKTKAILNLVNSQTSYNNIVFSLNRTANPFADFSYKKEPQGYSLYIFGLPFGIGLRIWMKMAANKIEKILRKEKTQFDLIHGHKLTFEGLIAGHLSKRFSVPYILSTRGDTDIRLVKILKLNQNLFLKALQNAKQIIFLAPWTHREMQSIYKREFPSDRSIILPNIIQLNNVKKNENEERYEDRFVSVFHLDSYKRKNIKRIVSAMNVVHEQHPHLKLDIIGGGKSQKKIEYYIKKCKHPSQFSFVGHKDHRDVLAAYSKYLGLILPSFPETFGLVFVEALHSGIPILYSRNSGIDGYFDNFKVCEKVDHTSVEQIAAGIVKIYEENSNYRQSIEQLKSEGGFLKFSEKSISNRYTSIISSWIN